MNLKLEQLQKKANSLPLLPGVYLMLDDKSEIIYVGKAKKLKNRVSSYFHGEHLPKVAAMVEKVNDFNVIVVESEFEALVLENSLIKRHKPHYNILLKDDKGYPFIRIDMRDEYPRISLSAKDMKDGAEYFGPFGGRAQTTSIINSISKALLLPDCSRVFPKDIGKERACLNYHIGTCEAWCEGCKDAAEYRTRINQACMLLNGEHTELIDMLTEEMNRAAEELRFENAAVLRDRIRSIEGLANKQRVISTSFSDTDAIGFFRGALSCFTVLHFVNGDLAGKDFELMEEPLEDDGDAVSSFVRQYYMSGMGKQPKRILLPCEIDDREETALFIAEKIGKKPEIEVPKRGERLRLIEGAMKNAEEEVKRNTTETQRRSKNLELLQKMLDIENFPERIEAFDVSNLGNTGIVAAMTVFINGKPLKKEYRKFKMSDMTEQDDYSAMYQAVYRRFRNYRENNEKFNCLPDLLLIDGGDKHAAKALQALNELEIKVPVFGMVKDDRHRTRALITPCGEEIGISGKQSIYSLIGSVQEETHRFAIEYQRILRNESYGSELDKIPGVGEKRKMELIRHFKSVRAIKNAGVEELKQVVPENIAVNIYSHFNRKRSDED